MLPAPSASNSTKAIVLLLAGNPPDSLYRNDYATFEADQVYNQHDAEGFIRLNALRLKVRALRDVPHTVMCHHF
jgi:argininosuccinate synthase